MAERQIEAEEMYTHMRSAEKIAGIYIADWARRCSAWINHQKYYTGIQSLLSSRKWIMKYEERFLVLFLLAEHVR